MILLRDVHKRFGSQVVLNGVDLDVQEGETLALLGPSGTGKSVLLKHIIGLIHPDSGIVMVDDEDVGKLRRKELAALRSRIGYVFQNGALFDSMDVFENVRLGITDQEAANKLWTQIDRKMTDAAPWAPLFNPKHIDFVSERLGNFIFNAQFYWMVSQSWVK